jgi:hypothetical protein
VTLNRPDKLNTIVTPMPDKVDDVDDRDGKTCHFSNRVRTDPVSSKRSQARSVKILIHRY